MDFGFLAMFVQYHNNDALDRKLGIYLVIAIDAIDNQSQDMAFLLHSPRVSMWAFFVDSISFPI